MIRRIGRNGAEPAGKTQWKTAAVLLGIILWGFVPTASGARPENVLTAGMSEPDEGALRQEKQMEAIRRQMQILSASLSHMAVPPSMKDKKIMLDRSQQGQ